MRLSKVFPLCAAGTCVVGQNITTGQLGDAVPVKNNPAGKAAIAELPAEPFFTSGSINGNIKGAVKATTGANGAGVDFEVTFSNLPAEGGPFTYHLHVDPVDASGNCTNTLAHLDPYIRGEDPACNPTKPASCQVGDLSGKYGKITSDPFTAKFHDDFTSLREGPGAYFLNRSVVVHFANKTRITCANFAVLGCPNNATTTSGSCQPTTTLLPPPISGGLAVMDGISGKLLATISMLAILFAI